MRHPLMLGHYRAMSLTGTERVMDQLIGGTLSVSQGLGLYPSWPGDCEVFLNTRANPHNPLQMPRPRAVVVVGLGDEGKLRAGALLRTVRNGVIAWARRLMEDPARNTQPMELASVLVGSGGSGISAEQAALLVVQGVLEASQHLTESNRQLPPASHWPRVGRLEIVELYLDRATEAWTALRGQSQTHGGSFQLDDVVVAGVGGLQRPLHGGYRGTRYDLLTAATVKAEDGDAAVSYVMDTQRARAEVRAQAIQGPLLRELVATASNEASTDQRIGRTLFGLLVPIELEPFLAGSTEALIAVDRGTAGIPWEMLDVRAEGGGDGDQRPWAIRAKLLRRLLTADFRERVEDATPESNMLVIGEPACNTLRYPRLPAAHGEAREVADLLERKASELRERDPGDIGEPLSVRALISADPQQQGADARTVLNTLLERDWRLIHITGHGEPPELLTDARTGELVSSSGDPRGVVLSNGIFLGPREIRSMRVVPELVFLSCCHLAARNPQELLSGNEFNVERYDRARFAASVAESLIGIGVRCVVAAGWAVEDKAASLFATTFYDRLLQGARFMDAIAAAREKAYEYDPKGNTWAAFQCYGDPDWILLRTPGGPSASPSIPDVETDGIASAVALVLALEQMGESARCGERERAKLPERLEALEKRFGERWAGRGAVAEAFGAAWAACDRPRAILWYEKALAANDGGASLRAAEQLGNLRARVAWESVEAQYSADAPLSEDTIDAARMNIQAALRMLTHLADEVHPSIERESLCGSAWKRLAMLEALVGRSDAEFAALAQMRERYARAEDMARKSRHPELFYPALNRIAADLIVKQQSEGLSGLDARQVTEVREALKAKLQDDPDFWSAADLIHLQVYEAIARGELAEKIGSIRTQYQDLYLRVSGAREWGSVLDQLRFVLPRYAAQASAEEREACKALIDSVASYSCSPSAA